MSVHPPWLHKSTPPGGIKFGQACRSLEQTGIHITWQTRRNKKGRRDESESRASQHAHEASAIAPQINSPGGIKFEPEGLGAEASTSSGK